MAYKKSFFEKVVSLTGREIFDLRGRVSPKKFDYQKRFVKFGVKRGDKVLDVGSGGEPFPLATHLLDLFRNETHHRAIPLKIGKKPFFQASAERLPFWNKSFDFVYCAHVLEHVHKPWIACEELMRVAKRGYIEVPTKTSDLMFNFIKIPDFHRWHVTMIGNTLVFFEYMDSEKVDTKHDLLFRMAHTFKPNPFSSFVWRHKNLLSNMFLWEGQFEYFVFNKQGKLLVANAVQSD